VQVVDLNIVGGKVYIHGGFVEASLAVDDGRVVKVAKEPNLPRADREIKVGGLLVLPGLVDVHVHLRDMELSYKEDFYTGTCAAAAGGYTTVLDMPNTKPPTTNPLRLKERIQKARSRVVVRVGLYSGLPDRLEDIPEMARLGATAFKVYLHKPITKLDTSRDDILINALSEIAKTGLPVSIHAEDAKTIQKLKKEKQTTKSILDRIETHPPEAEIKALKRIIPIIEKTKAKTHICHISTKQSIKIINEAKRKTEITCEATPHHLLLSEETVQKWGTFAFMDPPLRSRDVCEALLEGLRLGLIDVVASDHAPHTIEEKTQEDVWSVPPGIPGLETTLPLMLTLVDRGVLSWRLLVHLLSTRPAEIFGLPVGSIEVGGWADLVVVDAKSKYRIDPANFHSKAHYSPFEGWEVKGKPVMTLIAGKTIMRDGEILARPGEGAVILGRKINS